ncbi:MAG: DUF1549 and DUF1553 domain-containing protein [Gemmatales bacterium]
MRCFLILVFFPVIAHASEVKLYPPNAQLHGLVATQRVIVVEELAGKAVAEVSGKYQLQSSNLKVVSIEDGVITARANGEARIQLIDKSGKKQQSEVIVRVVAAEQMVTPSFQLDVLPILTKLGCNTGSCHGAMAGKGGFKLSLRGFDPDADHFVLTRQNLQRRIDFAKPEQSLFLTKPLNMVKHGGGSRLEAESPEHALLTRWIAAGAPGVQVNEPHLRQLLVFPPSARMNESQSLPVIVQAVYSDGRTVDVTRRAKFGSSEDAVLKVSDAGLITVSGTGAAAVTVLYSNQVGTMTLVSPYKNHLGPQSHFTSNNFIDEHVLNRLFELRLMASPACTDEEFLRRVFLDTIGTLPTPAEVERFARDTGADKRTRLIDQLLQRPEFVDYWTNRWADLFLISSKKLPVSNVWAFHQFLRRAVADNLPWNELARQVLTSRGSNLENGASNYFVMHKDISDLTETTALTFLGTSIACARCHNHPLEKWTQDQYWSMANLFGRVGMKSGSRANEVLVQPLLEGEVLHLRREKPMPPAPLDGPALPLSSSADRREHFVRWLTAAENPFFARAVVNRVWRNFMGRGLVESEDDIRQTNPPTNPALLEALEKDFITHGYDLRRLMRLILNSGTYQRSSRTVPGNESDDRFYSHYLVRRLKAEVILDAYSQVLDVPTPFNEVESGGRDAITATKDYPLGTRAQQLPDSRVVSRFLASFGRPEREQVCACEREADATVGQALHVNNGQTLNDKLRAKESRLTSWVTSNTSDEQIARELYALALSRPPTARELANVQTALASAGKHPATRREALEDLCWAVLSSKEFLFNH